MTSWDQVTDAQLQMSGTVPGSRYSFSARGATAALTAGPSVGGGGGGAGSYGNVGTYSSAATPAAPRLLGTGAASSSTPYTVGGGGTGSYPASSMTVSRYSSAVAGGGAAFRSAYGGGGAVPTTSSAAAPQQSAFKAFTPSAGLISGVGGGGGFAARSTYDVVADALNGNKEEVSGDGGMSFGAAAASGVGFMGRMSGGTAVPSGAAITPHRPPSGGGMARF